MTRTLVPIREVETNISELDLDTQHALDRKCMKTMSCRGAQSIPTDSVLKDDSSNTKKSHLTLVNDSHDSPEVLGSQKLKNSIEEVESIPDKNILTEEELKFDSPIHNYVDVNMSMEAQLKGILG